MKMLLAFLFALLMPMAALAQDTSQQAADNAKTWLALIDAGQYDQSWTDASTAFKGAVTQAQWVGMVKPVREPLGAVVSRNLDPPGVELTKSLPGAPAGDYAIVHFATKFAKGGDTKETVILTMDGGAWKVAGSFIKPATP